MCFITKRNSKVLVAKTDLVCFKSVTIDLNQSTTSLHLIPSHNYNSFRYKLGSIHTVINSSFDKLSKLMTLSIDGGAFHSYKTYSRLEHEIPKSYIQEYGAKFRNVRVQCTIPKGTRYVRNDTEYVSEQLRIDYILIEDTLNNMVHRYCDARSEQLDKKRVTDFLEKYCDIVDIKSHE